MSRKNTNWHVATTSAIKIDLRDYADILSYETEVSFWKNQFRLDMIIIRKTSYTVIDNPLAREFRAVNLFEIKGVNSTVSIPVFYKSLAYAGLYASEHSIKGAEPMQNISINLLGRSYPKNLINYLKSECHLPIEKRSPGVYHVGNMGFPIYIIVTRQLPPEDFLYLSCVTDSLSDNDIPRVDKMLIDLQANREKDPISYDDYLLQLLNAYSKRKDPVSMAIRKKVKPIHEMNLSELSHENVRLAAEISGLSAEISGLSAENSNLSAKNTELSAELESCQRLIEKLQQENLMLKNNA